MRNRGAFGGTTYGPGASLRHLLRLLVRRSKPTVAHRCYTERMRYLQSLVLRPCLIPFHAVKSKWEGLHCRVCNVLLLSPHAQQVYGCLPASIGDRGLSPSKFALQLIAFFDPRLLSHNCIRMIIIFAFNCPFCAQGSFWFDFWFGTAMQGLQLQLLLAATAATSGGCKCR